MKKYSMLKGAVCIAALTTAQAAYADISPEEVLDNWKQQLSSYGDGVVTFGNEVRNGDTLTVESLTFDFDEDGVQFSGQIDAIDLTENGDGTVTVTIPEKATFMFTDSTTQTGSMATIDLTQIGLKMLISGTVDNQIVETAANQIGLTLVDAMENGVAVPAEFSMSINDVYVYNEVAMGDLIRSDNTTTAGSVDLIAAITADGTTTDLSGQVTQLELSGYSVMPATYQQDDFSGALMDGFDVATTLSTGPSTIIATVEQADGTTSVATSAESGQMSMSVNKDGFEISASSTGRAFQVMGPGAPMPVNLSVESYGLNFAMPLSATDEPAPFAAGIDLVGLDISDDIWAIVDGANLLPHDPITVQAQLSGTGTLFMDLTDPAQMAALDQGAIPGELNSASLDTLLISVAGASIDATGAFTFDNADMVTFGGFPRPVGQITAHGKGLNGLMDKLGMMGLPISEQIAGFRMMLGMFTTAVGEDEVTTTLEINDTAQVLLNGNRIQ